MRSLWFFICVIVISCAPRAEAAGFYDARRPDPRNLMSLFIQAAELGGYDSACVARKGNGVDQECRLPEIHIRILGSNILGDFSPDDPNIVNVSRNSVPGTIQWNATLLHEFTHYFQWRFGKLTNDPGKLNCNLRVELEREAHWVQWLYLDKMKAGVPWSHYEEIVATRRARCEMGVKNP